jgi:transcription elongation factor Elf1
MSLFIDEKFLNSIGYTLRNFKKKSDNLWNFSCPICGDSKKNKLKARGYVFKAENALLYKCHKCGHSCSFGNLLKAIDSIVYKEYVYESFLEEKGEDKDQKAVVDAKRIYKPKKKVYAPAKPSVLNGCAAISTLGPDHPARMYLESRMIPKKFLNELYWTDDFPALVAKIDPAHEFHLRKEGRIIIPFLDRKGQLLAVQGRSLEPDAEIRYITIKAFEDAPRIFGMHRLSKIWKRIYVVEGPFDSLFLPNCIAMAGSDIPPEFPTDKTVIVYDNEPKKKETVEKIAKAIDRNYRVCIWPDSIRLKDINLMIQNGYSEAKIREIIDTNSYTGLEAKLKLQHWSNPRGNRKDVK